MFSTAAYIIDLYYRPVCDIRGRIYKSVAGGIIVQINILIVIDIFYKEHAIIVMIMLYMFILGDRFIKAIIACF